MGTISSVWTDYSQFINLIKAIIPNFKSEEDHVFNKHVLDDKDLGELVEIRDKLTSMEVFIKGLSVKGLRSIHASLSILAKEENFDLTEFQAIYDTLETTLDDYISQLSSINTALNNMAEEISRQKLSEIKHKFFRTFPDNHHDYDKDIQRGFVHDFKNKILNDLLLKKWTIKDLNDYTSLRFADEIVDKLYS